jgi:hypothetical protein
VPGRRRSAAPGTPLVSGLESYTRLHRVADHGAVTVDRGLDPVTGLPVLLYRFPGDPTPGADELDHDGIWRVLDEGSEDGDGFLVTQVVEQAIALEKRPASLDDASAAAALAVVAVAAAAGVPHGDLGVHRVYRRGASVWVEGYGVPWADATPEDDVRALARSMLALGGHALSPRAVAGLEAVAGDGDPAHFERALAAPEPAPDEAGPADAEDGADVPVSEPTGVTPVRNAAPPDFDDVRIATDTPAPDAPAPDPLTPDTAAPDAATTGAAAPTPTSARREGSARVSARPSKAARATFSKRPPPDVTYRHAPDTWMPERVLTVPVEAMVGAVRDRRRVWLLAALVVAAVALVLLTTLGRPAGGSDTGVGTAGVFVLDVRLAPERHPPASLVVVSSPSGSQFTPGTVLGSVPRRVALDRDGTWQFQARFQDRRSDLVTVVIPETTAVTLTFPEVTVPGP